MFSNMMFRISQIEVLSIFSVNGMPVRSLFNLVYGRKFSSIHALYKSSALGTAVI